MELEGSHQVHPLQDGKGNLRGWLREIGKEDREECKWCGEGFEDGEHIVFHSEKMWRPEVGYMGGLGRQKVDRSGREEGRQGGRDRGVGSGRGVFQPDPRTRGGGGQGG